MGLKLNGATSGSIEIDVPAVAGTDTAITIPATTGGEFIVSDSSGNIDLGPLDINGGASDDSVNIDGSGNLGLNETTPSDFNDAGTGGVNFVIGATGAGRGVLTFAAEQTGGADEPLGIINFVDSDTTNASTRGARILGMRGSDANSTWIRFDTANSGDPLERMRVDDDGSIRLGTTALTSNGGGNFATLVVSESQSNTHVSNTFNTHVSFSDQVIIGGAYNGATSGYTLLALYTGNGSSSAYNDREFQLRGDGNGYCDGSWAGGGADYAEYFEWSDGNSNEEDRRGISVVLDGDKIREAVAGEDPIGVISGNPSVVGDADMDRWKQKYLRDDFGAYVLQEHEKTDDEGNTFIQTHRVLNPEWDDEMDYISRENRPEWDAVGLMGKLRIRKGQVTGARWIKMRDISDSVEEWLVR